MIPEAWLVGLLGVVFLGGLGVLAAVITRGRRAARFPFTPDREPPDPRRIHPRRGGNPLPALLRVESSADTPCAAEIVDRSVGGVRFGVETGHPPGTLLCVRTCAAPPETPWIRVIVRHSRRVNDRWEVGCQFLEPLPWNLLLLFG